MRNPLTGCMKVQASVSYCLTGPGFDCATMGLRYSNEEFRSILGHWNFKFPNASKTMTDDPLMTEQMHFITQSIILLRS